jgi:hypothetical protein
MLSFLLRRRGWDVVYLGANVPLSRLDATMQYISPRLILSVAQTLNSAASLQEMARYVNLNGVPLGFGGGIFNSIPDLQERIPGYFLGNELAEAPQAVESLLVQLPPLPQIQPVSPEYRQLLERYVTQEAHILASISAELLSTPIQPAHLEEANSNFTRSIISALSLGNINYLNHSIRWLEGLLENYGLSPMLAMSYFASYRRAVQQHLGDQAWPILDWLIHVDQIVH